MFRLTLRSRLAALRPARRALAVLGLALIAGLGGAAPAARAATLIVTTTTDDGGAGSRRAQIAAAAPGDTINFAVTGTITLAAFSPLVLDKDLAIRGPGADQLTVSANGLARVFVIDGATVAISGLTLADGNAFDVGGAMRNTADLTLDACVVSDSRAGWPR